MRRVKAEGLLPLGVIVEDGGQQRIDRGPLQMDQEDQSVSEVLLRQRRVQSDLLDEETLEGDVLAGFVRKCHGDDVGQPLSLVDDCVRKGKVPPVFNLNLSRSDHPAQLLLHLVWERRGGLFPLNEECC